MAESTSENVTASLRVMNADENWSVTSDQMAETLHDHMVGKTVIITGVSKNGLGAEAARVISKHSPKLLILASRKESTIREVIKEISETASPDAKFLPVELDLGSQWSVRAAASKILETVPVIDVLINNAGIMMLPKFSSTNEGIEAHFGTNHIGHFLFTNLLMPALLKSEHGGRVVNISSAGAAGSPIRFDDYNFGHGETYEPFLAYAQSKCANLLFSLELAKRLGSKGIISFGVDPGSIPDTQLSRQIPREVLVSRGWFVEKEGKLIPNPTMPFITAAQSIASYVKAAYDPTIEGKNGGIMRACAFLEKPAPHMIDTEAAEKLWKLSEELVAEKFEY